MARTIDWVDRISEAFDHLGEAEKLDMAAELFSRLDPADKVEAHRRIQFHMRMERLLDGRKRNGKPDTEIKSDPENAEDLLALEEL